MSATRGRLATIDPMLRLRAGALAILVLLAACSSPSASPTQTTVTSATETTASSTPIDPEPTPTPVDPSSAGQADTDWGLIWLAVPNGFPWPPPGRSAEPESGPASAAWINAPDALLIPAEVAGYFVGPFTDAGYTVSRDGPLEDGSYTVSASNGSACEIFLTVVPRGEEVLTTVMYGAGCPFSWPVT